MPDLLHYLKKHCQGRNNVQTAAEIGLALGIDERRVGILARKLKKEGHLVLGTCKEPAGYFIPQSMAEVEAVAREHESRAIKTLQEIRWTKRNAKREFSKDQELVGVSS